MNRNELIAFYERWEVPYVDTPIGLRMLDWGKIPLHLQVSLAHSKRTGGQNRDQRRGHRAKDRVRGKVRT